MALWLNLKKRINEALSNAPLEWKGTTFNIPFIGTEKFKDITMEFLTGKRSFTDISKYTPTDYARLGTPFSAMFEVKEALALCDKFSWLNSRTFIHHAFSLSSIQFALPSLILSLDSGHPIEVLGKPLFCKGHLNIMTQLGGNVDFVEDFSYQNESLRVVFDDTSQINSDTHVFVSSSKKLLFILNDEFINPDDIDTIRKRFLGPNPLGDVIKQLSTGGDYSVNFNNRNFFERNIAKHVHQMAGNPVTETSVVTTTGLAALATALTSVHLEWGPCNVLMPSNPYGGTWQLMTLLSQRLSMSVHTFDITRHDVDVNQEVDLALPKALTDCPMILFLEYPTNPDMHYINLKRLKESVLSKMSVTGKSRCLLILDTTFSPQSQPLGVLGNDFPVIIFNSGSKSLTGGKTTLGTLVGNQNPIAKKLIQSCFNINKWGGFQATDSQLQIAANEVPHTTDRINVAYAQAKSIVQFLRNERLVNESSIKFISKEQENANVLSATFSFSLPRIHGRDQHELVQEFVRLLSEHDSENLIKRCVSFGQIKPQVYVTIPGSSTQGALPSHVSADESIRISLPTSKIDLEYFKKLLRTVFEIWGCILVDNEKSMIP